MPYSYAIYTGNGSQTQFALTFPYIRKEHVKVYVNYVDTAYTYVNDTTVQLASAPANGVRVEVRRITPLNAPLVDYTDGSTLVAADLDTSNLQHLYKQQELDDDNKQAVFIDPATGLPTANGQRITNVANPTAAQDAATKGYVDTNFWDNTTDTIDSGETWVSSNDKIGTTAAHDSRHTMVISPTTPSAPAGGWQIGKQWYQSDVNQTLSYWNGSSWVGITSGGTFNIQATVIYVDAANGNDANDGHRIISPKKTIKNAVASASAGDIVRVAPGVYREALPIDITVANLSIVGDSIRSCFIHPTAATETSTIFRCNSGTYIANFTFAGLKASGARGGNAVDSDPTYGLPAAQGWVAGFYPGATIVKSPYIQNCTNFSDAGIDNSNFNPNNLPGTAGDLTSSPTGGGIIVDGSLPSTASPLRSFLVDSFTQICLDGPGTLVCNNGYAQLTSSYGFFNHYHVKALNGGQVNLSASTTDFGRYGLIADGRSSTAIFSATAAANANINDISFTVGAPTAAPSWFGDATRPAENMVVQIGANSYPILSATPSGLGWTVTISRPDPTNQSVNLGLIAAINSGDAVNFYLRSLISTSGHTMEYVGSGTNYTALPENGGVPVEANQVVDLNNGKVWISSTDHNGKFKVGSTLTVDQRTGFVTIPSGSISFDLASDLTPQLGGNLDVLNRTISSSTGSVVIDDTVLLNNQSALRFGEATGHGGNWVAFQAPSTIASNITWTLPSTDATVAGYALVSDTSGNLSWGRAGGATGGGVDDIFYENGQTVTTNYTITAGKNAMSAGPITINSGATVTVGSGQSWIIL
jgi:hypothetical protein